MLTREPDFFPTLEEAVEAFIQKMEEEAREGRLVHRFALIARDDANGWICFEFIVGESANLYERVLWGTGSLAAVLRAEVVAEVGHDGSVENDNLFGWIRLERRDAGEVVLYHFTGQPGQRERIVDGDPDSFGSDFLFLPGGTDPESWGCRKHERSLNRFADKNRRRRSAA